MFQRFISAFANGNYTEALLLWDKYHKTFEGQHKIIANDIVKLIDKPKPLF